MKLFHILALASAALAQTTEQAATATGQATAATNNVPTTTGAGAAAASGSTLPDLVAQIPECALGCYNSAVTQVGCANTDLSCLCGVSGVNSSVITSLGACLAFASCKDGDIEALKNLATSVCNRVSAAPSAELASASQAIASELATVPGASASASTTASGGGTVPTMNALLGVGVMVAYVL